MKNKHLRLISYTEINLKLDRAINISNLLSYFKIKIKCFKGNVKKKKIWNDTTHSIARLFFIKF